MTDRRNLEKFGEKSFRDGYLQTTVRGWIAYQIQALREKTGLTQQAFAERLGKKQSTISRLENSEYGKVTVQTLLDVACSLDVALQIRFVSYPEFLNSIKDSSVEAMQPATVYESLDFQPSLRVVAGGGALARASESAEQSPWQSHTRPSQVWQLGEGTLWKSVGGGGDIGHANANAFMNMTPSPIRSAAN